MEYCEELIKYIESKENRNAIAFLEKLRSNSPCTSYGEAREKILIIESAKLLNKKFPFMYADEKALIKNLFEDGMSAEKAVEILCALVRDCTRVDKQASFQKALSYIGENMFSCQLTVGSVAEYTGLSQSELVKLFKENIAVTPGDYIGEKRCVKSIEYLTENKSVEKVALCVGFSVVETYIRTFKKHMGITPGMWKKKNL